MTTMSARSSVDPIYRIGPYWFNPEGMTVTHERGERIQLTRTEVLFLEYLHRAKGRSVDRAELLQKVWGFRPDLNTHRVEQHVYRLRRKIEPDPSEFRLLLWRDGGYLLAA